MLKFKNTNIKNITVGTLLLACLGYTLNIAAAADDQTKPGDSAPADTSADQEKMMKAWEEAGKITPQHKALEYLTGTWTVQNQWWPTPGAQPEKTTGKAHFEAVLGGRYIRENFDGSFMGKPFQGLSYLGYDNLKKKYVSTWMDSMSTRVFMMEGDSTDKGKTIKSSTEFFCEMENRQKKMRSVMKKINNNEMHYQHFDVGADGKEFKSLEIVYKRELPKT